MLITFNVEYVHIHMFCRMLLHQLRKYSALYKKMAASCARPSPVTPD